MILLLIVALSVVSMIAVYAILTAPDLPHERAVVAPIVIHQALDEGYFDTRGLV